MEAGNSAARDCDEERREDSATCEEAVSGRSETCKCRHGRRTCAGQRCADDRNNCHDDHKIEQERAQVIARLQQDPHRSDRRDQNVKSKDIHPGLVAHGNRMPVETDEDDQNNADTSDDGSDADIHIISVHKHAEHDGQHDKEYRDDGRGEVGIEICTFKRDARSVRVSECGSDDGCKCRHNQQQRQPRKCKEQPLCLLPHCVADDFADGLAAVANGREQRSKVMHTAEENAADDDPEEHRHPAENCCLNRPVDRSCACNRREMMSHEDRGFGRNVIHAVGELVGRSLSGRIHAPLFGEPSAVEEIAAGEEHKAD